jgi:hypothetical protein
MYDLWLGVALSTSGAVIWGVVAIIAFLLVLIVVAARGNNRKLERQSRDQTRLPPAPESLPIIKRLLRKICGRCHARIFIPGATGRGSERMTLGLDTGHSVKILPCAGGELLTPIRGRVRDLSQQYISVHYTGLSVAICNGLNRHSVLLGMIKARIQHKKNLPVRDRCAAFERRWADGLSQVRWKLRIEGPLLKKPEIVFAKLKDVGLDPMTEKPHLIFEFPGASKISSSITCIAVKNCGTNYSAPTGEGFLCR